MKIADMDAYDIANEISRCRAVAKRHGARAATMVGSRAGADWQYASDRHAARAAKLTEIAKASTDPELPSYLKLFGVTL